VERDRQSAIGQVRMHGSVDRRAWVPGAAAAAVRPLPASRAVRMDRRVVVVATTLLAFLLGGLLLEVGPGSRFVVAPGYQYKAYLVPAVLYLTPLLWLLMFLARQRQKRLNPHMPRVTTGAVLKMALALAIVAAGVPAALYGWTAAAGWAVGEPRTGIDATLVSIERASSVAKGCRQRGTVEVGGFQSRICVFGLLDGVPQRPAQKLRLSGQASRFGLLVERMQPAGD
jgi:hypothetical protein